MIGRSLSSLRGLLLAALLTLPLATAGIAASASAQDEDPAESRATSFQAVEGNTREEVAGGPLMLGAYATVWVVLIGYAGYMGLIHRRTEQKLTDLRRVVEAAKDRGGEAD